MGKSALPFWEEKVPPLLLAKDSSGINDQQSANGALEGAERSETPKILGGSPLQGGVLAQGSSGE